MRIMPFNAILPRPEKIDDIDDFFNAVKFDFPSLYISHFDERKTPALYIYKIVSPADIKLGMIACTDLSLGSDKHILAHESTLEDKERKLMELAMERKAMIKPVLMIYPDNELLMKKLSGYIDKNLPIVSLNFNEENETHFLWELNQNDSKDLQNCFHLNVPKAYIADGHHRFKISRQLKTLNSNTGKLSKNIVLSIFLPFSQVEILSYDRIVDFGGKMDRKTFIQSIAKYFEIEKLPKADQAKQANQIIMLLGVDSYSLKVKRNHVHLNDDLAIDVVAMQKYILEDILAIQDVQNDKRISYVPAKDSLQYFFQELKKSPEKVAFLFASMKLKNIIEAADRGRTLPPKSSWFKPRIKNAIISIKIYS